MARRANCLTSSSRFGEIWPSLVRGRRLPERRVALTRLRGGAGSSPVWLWQFHQGIVGLLYYAMLLPLWFVRGWVEPLGSYLFFATLIAVGVAGSLRFHLWFTQRFNPAEIRAQRAQVFPWIRGADCLFVLVLLVATAVILVDHAVWATFIGSIAIGCFLSFLIFEPATTRAAFRRSRTRSSRPGGPRKTGTSKTRRASQSE